MLYIISIIITVYWNFGWFLLPHWLRAYQFIFIPEILMFKPFSNAVGFLDFHPWNRELENVHRKLRSRPTTFLGSQVQHFKNFWNNPKLPKPVNWLREPHPNILHSQSSPTTSLGRVSTARSCTMPRPSERPWKAKRVSGTCRLSAKASKLQHPGDSWLSNGLEQGGLWSLLPVFPEIVLVKLEGQDVFWGCCDTCLNWAKGW